jgi:dTDP-4-dehydrorhamnose 3,5-epimerase
MIDGVILSPLKTIHVDEGDIFHGMKLTDEGYCGFGEAYFSSIKFKETKGWKRHHKMTLNIIVPFGEIQFALFDDRNKNIKRTFDVVLSKKNYHRLTIPPMVWVAFKGLDSNGSMLLNIANLAHDPSESDSKNINEIQFDWSS